MYPCENIFLKKNKFLEDLSPFNRATDTPVLDFWWCLALGFKAREDSLTCMLCYLCARRFLRFTSGATPADFLAASWWGSSPDSSMPLPHNMWQDRRFTAMPARKNLKLEILQRGKGGIGNKTSSSHAPKLQRVSKLQNCCNLIRKHLVNSKFY